MEYDSVDHGYFKGVELLASIDDGAVWIGIGGVVPFIPSIWGVLHHYVGALNELQEDGG